MKVEVSAETYQVGAHFKALIKATLVAPLKSFERFFRISSYPAGLKKPLLPISESCHIQTKFPGLKELFQDFTFVLVLYL